MSDEILDLKGAIDEIVNQNLGRRMNSEIVYCKLISLDPLDFIPENDDKLHIMEEYLVVPKYRPFTKKDLGKKFVLISNDGGQTYFYLYEASEPQGSNGIPYHFEGTHEFINGEMKCTLHGTCPHGDVVVTHGSVESYKGKIKDEMHRNHIND